jgi:hypothetical protein
MTEELAPMADSEIIFNFKKKGAEFIYYLLFDLIMNFHKKG